MKKVQKGIKKDGHGTTKIQKGIKKWPGKRYVKNSKNKKEEKGEKTKTEK